MPIYSYGQIRAGAGYLKLLPGARVIGTSGTVTGALDYTYSFYANPAAAGFLREWQWSVTYTNWISDIYNASFLYGRQIRMPWSRHTRFVLGINYLGIPEFDSSNDKNPPVSGNNLLVTASMGQPLRAILQHLSFGANIKYFNSELARFETNTIIYDLGLLFRTARINFLQLNHGLLEYAIFSAGIAVSNLGNSIQFLSEGTPLPQTIRAGIALNLGSHQGFQTNFAIDYRRVRDENGFITLGSEVSWSRLVTMRFGYSFEDNLLGHFTFGGSLRLDDLNIIPGKNNALQFDLTANQSNAFFASPYHGSVTHYPIQPESFKLTSPSYGALIDSDSVTLTWEETWDPDLYDDLNYWLLVDQDSVKLAKALEIEARNSDEVFIYLKNDIFLINRQFNQTYFTMNNLTGGDYYWTVLAFDKDKHIRFAEMKHRKIAKFHVTAPDPKVISIRFEYSPWITEDDYQGVLKFTIMNAGDRAARNFSLSIYDSIATKQLNEFPAAEVTNVQISQLTVPEIQPAGMDTISIEWRTKQPGFHYILTEITKTSSEGEIEIVNKNGKGFYTIPKGTFATDDTVIALKINNFIYELPTVGKVFFDSGSADINKSYIRKWIMEPPLVTFANRLKEYPNLKIFLKGTADPNSGENDIALANARAHAVRDSLYALGVALNQMEILPGVVLPLRRSPRNPLDALWVMEERRYVDIIPDTNVDKSAEEKLFSPLQSTYDEIDELPVTFSANIAGVVSLREGIVLLQSNNSVDSLTIKDKIDGPNLIQSISWLPNQIIKSDDLEKKLTYSVVLSDTLDRKFKIQPQQVYLKKQITPRERIYYIIAKFKYAKPFYKFYWSNLLARIPFLLEDQNTRMRFIGHGCAIGPESVNRRLSQKRAKQFYQIFLNDIKKRYPDLYDQIKQRINPPEGHGESEPLTFKSKEGATIMLGDNNTPLGRQLNRRVMVKFYISSE